MSLLLCLSTKALREGKRCVTAHWLNTVLKKKVMVPPHRTLHVPFAFPPGAKPCSHHVSRPWTTMVRTMVRTLWRTMWGTMWRTMWHLQENLCNLHR